MKEEDIRLIKQEIKNNREAGECGLASNNEKLEWTKTADALEKALDCITNLQEENERLKKLKERYQLEKEDYKTRNEKAIEYIGEENRGDYDNFVIAIGEDNGCPSRACEELLEILKGKSDE